jgi:hypothetical protein
VLSILRRIANPVSTNVRATNELLGLALIRPAAYTEVTKSNVR